MAYATRFSVRIYETPCIKNVFPIFVIVALKQLKNSFDNFFATNPQMQNCQITELSVLEKYQIHSVNFVNIFIMLCVFDKTKHIIKRTTP